MPLGPSGTLIGRSSVCHVVVDEPSVSRKHLLILHADGATRVIPLGRGRPQLRGAKVLGPTLAEDGDELVIGTARFTFEIRGDRKPQAAKRGARRVDSLLPTAVVLEPLPEGVRLRVTVGTERTVVLAQRRGDLARALLSGGIAGEWVEDNIACELVWGAAGGSRARLNTLIHRTRASLSEVGLDGSRLIERAPGGGATRFALAPQATVSVRRRA